MSRSSNSCEELRSLYEQQQQAALAVRPKSSRAQQNLEALGAVRDSFGTPPVLKPHDIDVIELDGSLTCEALQKLLSHEACAVHVRNFLSRDECSKIEVSLDDDALYSNWAINKLSGDDDGLASEVDKIGVVSSEAMDSFESFCAYLAPANGGVEQLLERDAGVNPFQRLIEQLDEAHPQGCRRNKFQGRWPIPAGTFRRMRSSRGLVHADTATLLSPTKGEFSANLYIRTPRGSGASPEGSGGSGGSGALCIYPARQYSGDGGIFGATSPALLADLQALARQQADGFSGDAQAYIRAALPLKRRLELRDGDLVLINTGRFHEVEPYDDGHRLSGQSWLSFEQGKPLMLWV